MGNSAVLKYVQVDQQNVLIDSRVYCRDIINVDHGDWLSDTLEKHKTVIEKRFGAIRFQTDVLKHQNYRGSTRQKYALLTEAQCNACLVLSKNLAETVVKKLELVADFELAKHQIKAYLQNTLNQDTSTNVEALQHEIVQLKERLDFVTKKALHWERKAFQTEFKEDISNQDTEFKYDAVRLWLITGIKDYSYFSRTLQANYVLGVDYHRTGWTKEDRKSGMSQGLHKLLFTSEASISIVLTYRSSQGCLKSQVPESYHFLFEALEESKINRRRLQSR